MVECPVCHRTFANDFALQGHIRLKKDSEHLAFKRQQIKMASQKTMLPGSILTQTQGDNLLDALEALVRNQEYLDEEKAKANSLLMRIKDMVEQERTIEKEYQRLIDENNAELEHERQKVREEVMVNYQEDVNRAVAKVKDDIMQNWQKAVDSAFVKGKKLGYNEGFYDGKYEWAIWYYCDVCDSSILIKPDSDIHRFIIDCLRAHGWGHIWCHQQFIRTY